MKSVNKQCDHRAVEVAVEQLQVPHKVKSYIIYDAIQVQHFNTPYIINYGIIIKREQTFNGKVIVQ